MKSSEFSLIVNSTKAVVLSAIGKFLSEENYEALDDVVQETYLRAYNALSKGNFKGESSISTWLYQIAKNESLRMNKKLERNKAKQKKLEEKMVLSTNDFSENNKNDLLNQIKDFIVKLPVKYRAVIERQLQGKKENIIAEELEISRGTVKSRSFRAKEILRKWANIS
jgi:RNA polymerase sigma-70 factor (ECF subfamily)